MWRPKAGVGTFYRKLGSRARKGQGRFVGKGLEARGWAAGGTDTRGDLQQIDKGQNYCAPTAVSPNLTRGAAWLGTQSS